MADVFSGEDVKIYIDPTSGTSTSFDVNTSQTAYEVQTSMFSFNQSGGEFETETKPLLGGANIVIEKPATEVELEFEVAIKTDNPTFWDELFYGSGLTSATRGNDFTVGIEATDSATGKKYQILYHNVKAVSFEKSVEAGEYLTGTLTLKLAPTDENGNANIKIGDDQNTVFDVI